MKNNIKKVLVMGCVAICAMVGVAAPRHGGHSMHHHAPVHHYSHCFWGPGGRNFWPGFVGGVIGGALYGGI